MKKTKTQKGITLIALIITIVVLMILAVVAINAVKDGGIIQHAQDAATAYKYAEAEEQAKLFETSIKMKLATDPVIYTTEDHMSGDDSISDNGAIYEFLVEQGLTPLPIAAIVEDENGKKYILFERGAEIYLNYSTVEAVLEIPVRDNNGKNFIAQVETKHIGKYNDWKIIDVKINTSSQLEDLIISINEDIVTNSEQYTFDGLNLPLIQKIYGVLEAKGFTIVSEKLVNEEGVLNQQLFNQVVSVDYSTTYGTPWKFYGTDIECSKDGKNITVRAQVYVKGNAIINPFKIK